MPKPQRRSSSNRSNKQSRQGGKQPHNSNNAVTDLAALTTLWQQWRNAQGDTPQPLDRWLSKHHHAQRQRKAGRNSNNRQQVWQLNAAMMSAARFQQLACALEAQFYQHDEIDWQQWDLQWQEQQLDDINTEALWYWLGLRGDGDWLSANKSSSTLRDGHHRERLYGALQQQALAEPLSALWLLWHGIRPQWLPLLQQRAEQSGWNDKQLQGWVKKQGGFPPLWLRAKPGVDLNELAAQLQQQEIKAETRIINGESVIAAYGGRAVQSSEQYKQGDLEIQDLASQQIAAAVAARPGDKVWDACAGAGGKTLAIAAQMNNKGSLYATDLQQYKLDELKRRAKRAEVQNVRTFVWDGTDALRLPAEVNKQQGFDRVLLDAPCTSAGTWRRNPDARWRFSAEDSQQLTKLQQQLLHFACAAVRPGGELVYATCSWQLAENEQQVEDFLQSHSQFELVEQCMLGAPDEDADTMFYARLKRTAKV